MSSSLPVVERPAPTGAGDGRSLPATEGRLPPARPGDARDRSLPAGFGGGVLTAVVLALLVGAWELLVRALSVPIYLVPPPSAVFDRLVTRPGFFAGQTAITVTEALGGLAVGGLVAAALAVVMVHSPAAERVIYPIALIVKVTPIVAIAPLLVIWFGFGPLPKVIIAALVTFFPVLINTITGLRDVNPGILDVLRSVAAPRREVLIKVRVPSALPYLFAAVRVAVPLSLIGAVVAEWWGASDGLGRVIFLANSNLDMPTLFAAIVALGVTGILLTAVLAVAEQRLLSWHDSARRT